MGLYSSPISLLIMEYLVESNNTVIAALGLDVSENGWNDDGGEIPSIHDNLGSESSGILMGVPKGLVEDERPDKGAVYDKQDHQKLDVSPEHNVRDSERSDIFQCDEPALLNAHQQHSHLPKHVWNVMKGETDSCRRIAIMSVRRVNEHHVEVHERDELNNRQSWGSCLEAREFWIGLNHDTVVMQDHKCVAWKGVEHDNQCSTSLGWVEVQHGTGVTEVEHLVNESLCLIEVTWCSMEDLVHRA